MVRTGGNNHSPTTTKDGFPAFQLFILGICRLAEPIAITSIFPYAWLMVKDFQFGSPNDASFWAGILISAFSLSEAITGMFWGSISDRIGRKPVLLLGCLGTTISLVIVGFATDFSTALFGRVIGGLLNGNIGVIQTMVGEIVKNPEHEARAYSVMPFVWAIGCIIGPAIGGTLADPVAAFPTHFTKHGFWEQHPWLLPNFICAILMVLSMLAGYLWLKETHPKFQRLTQNHTACHTPPITATDQERKPLSPKSKRYGTLSKTNFAQDAQQQFNQIAQSRSCSNTSIFDKETLKWLDYNVLMLVSALGLFTYHSMCYDHLLPIFLQDDRLTDISIMSTSPFDIPGGLGLTTKSVGMIMAVNGMIALFTQAMIFPWIADRMTLWNIFVMVTLLQPLVYFIVPFIAFLPANLLMPGIYLCLGLRNFCAILVYPVILILLKQSSPSPSTLGRINGLAASVGAALRTIAPPVAGLLYGLGAGLGFTGLAWFGAGAVALVGGMQIWFIPRKSNGKSTV